jgi:hypothetical protein
MSHSLSSSWRDLELALAIQKRHRPHLAQVHSYRILGLPGVPRFCPSRSLVLGEAPPRSPQRPDSHTPEDTRSPRRRPRLEPHGRSVGRHGRPPRACLLFRSSAGSPCADRDRSAVAASWGCLRALSRQVSQFPYPDLDRRRRSPPPFLPAALRRLGPVARPRPPEEGKGMLSIPCTSRRGIDFSSRRSTCVTSE